MDVTPRRLSPATDKAQSAGGEETRRNFRLDGSDQAEESRGRVIGRRKKGFDERSRDDRDILSGIGVQFIL